MATTVTPQEGAAIYVLDDGTLRFSNWKFDAPDGEPAVISSLAVIDWLRIKATTES